MRLFLLILSSLACSAAWAGEVANTVKDVKLAEPYLWEVASFFGMLGVLRVTQWIKRIRWFPDFLCNKKTSKDGLFKYNKLKKKYLIGFATVASFGVITLCLSQRHEDLQQVMIIAGVIAFSQFTIIEFIFTYLDKKSPGTSDILSNGLYIPGEDATVYTKFVQVAVGGDVDKRDKTRKVVKKKK